MSSELHSKILFSPLFIEVLLLSLFIIQASKYRLNCSLSLCIIFRHFSSIHNIGIFSFFSPYQILVSPLHLVVLGFSILFLGNFFPSNNYHLISSFHCSFIFLSSTNIKPLLIIWYILLTNIFLLHHNLISIMNPPYIHQYHKYIL